MEQAVRDTLIAFADPAYRAFIQPLVKTDKEIIGVRLSHLHSLARQLAKNAPLALIHNTEDLYHEETLLWALVIAYAPIAEKERLALIDSFLPHIDNWEVCDSFCTALKTAKKEQKLYRPFLEQKLVSFHPYTVRFAVVMLLCHFIDETTSKEILELLATVKKEERCVRMAIGWAVATCFAVDPDRTFSILFSGAFDKETLRIAVQKIRESRRINAVWKQSVSSAFTGKDSR